VLWVFNLSKTIFQGKFESKNWILEGDGGGGQKVHTEERVLAQSKCYTDLLPAISCYAGCKVELIQ